MFTRRFVQRLLLTTLAFGPGALVASADSSSAVLSVGVTVVRSCAVSTRPAAQGLATVDLKCTAGAGASLQKASSANVATTPFRDARTGDNMQVVTLNF
jgi:hypothetical protein